MRISELIGAKVVDGDGADLGCVHDVRITVAARRGRATSLRVAGLVIGSGGWLSRAAHRWGYAEGRAEAPLALKWLTSRATLKSRFVPARRVEAWGPQLIRISGAGDQLKRTIERVRGE